MLKPLMKPTVLLRPSNWIWGRNPRRETGNRKGKETGR